MRPFARKNQAAWEDFFDLLPGTPRRIVADMDGAIERAVDAPLLTARGARAALPVERSARAPGA